MFNIKLMIPPNLFIATCDKILFKKLPYLCSYFIICTLAVAELMTTVEKSSLDSPKQQDNKRNPASPALNHNAIDEEEPTPISDEGWINLSATLGSAGSSKVFEGCQEKKTCEVAIKRVRQGEADELKSNELDILQTTRHDNLLQSNTDANPASSTSKVEASPHKSPTVNTPTRSDSSVNLETQTTIKV